MTLAPAAVADRRIAALAPIARPESRSLRVLTVMSCGRN